MIKALLAPLFKIKRYGKVRFKKNSNSKGYDCPQDYAISESQITYNTDYTHENWALRGKNAVLLNFLIQKLPLNGVRPKAPIKTGKG